MPNLPAFIVQEYAEALPPYIQVLGLADPVSLQAKGGKKSRYIQELRSAVSAATELVFLGDVRVEIVWIIDLDARYRTHIVADIDNIVKPILDGLTGPNCIMVDDNQVQSLNVSWTTPPMINNAKVEIRLESSDPDAVASREHLVFVEFEKALCFPIQALHQDAIGLQVTGLRRLLEAESKLVALGMPSRDARLLRSVQRSFPRARLGGFKIIDAEMYPG